MSLNKIMLLVLLIFAFAIQPVNILAENTDEKLTGKIIRINHRPANSLIEVLKVYLSGEGKIIADEHTNSIVIRDFPGNIGKIEAMAANLDVPLPQVKIGVTILDTANTNTASIFGSAYNVNNKWNVAVSPDISQVQNRGTTNMTLTTLSGSSAFIRIGKRVPFTDWFYSYALGHNYITKTTVFQEVSTGFYVTPRVNQKNIVLEIAPGISYFDGTRNNRIIFREMETTVSLKDGQTAVISTSETDRHESQGLISRILGYSSTDQNASITMMVTTKIKTTPKKQSD